MNNDNKNQYSPVSSGLGTPVVPYHKHGGSDGPLIPLQNVSGYFPMVTTTPTFSPSGSIQTSIALNSTTGEIFYYDFTNKTWKNTSPSSIVTSFNTRTGAVVLINADVLAASDTIQTYTPSAAGTATLDLSKGNYQRITMPAGNITIAISNGTVGQPFLVDITQDSVGSRTVTWFTTIKWSGGVVPTLTTAANKIDTFGFTITSAGNYQGYIVGQDI